jgi:membrane protease YdiL (CAAX protease family)
MLEPQGPQDSLPPQPSTSRGGGNAPWTSSDLILFGLFFGLTVLFLPAVVLSLIHIFRPAIRVNNLSAVDQVVIQGIMDLVLVGFIMFLVKLVHGRSFLETIHWYRPYPFRFPFLITVGAFLAITVMIVSSIFPPSSTPPIEKLISSARSLYVFAIFGIGLAPLFEEVIFRGFLFKVFADISGPRSAIPWTAGLFALLHVPQLWGSWAGIALIFGVGYVLAVLRDRSGSLIPSLIVHMSYNGMLFGMYALTTLVQHGAGT